MTQAAEPVQTRRQMKYLSVHDLVWLNATITGETQPFNYVALEEAMAAQYSYGESRDVPRQAANLLDTLVNKAPFQCGNVRTGFIATAAFLSANGYALKVGDDEAARILRAVHDRATSPWNAVGALSEPADIGLRPGATLRALITHLLNTRTDALRQLAPCDEAGPAGAVNAAAR